MPSGTGVRSVPFAPFTSNSRSRIVTVTPFGTVIAFFPMRDMILNLRFSVFGLCALVFARVKKDSSLRLHVQRPKTKLINLCQHFAAYVLAAGSFGAPRSARSLDVVETLAALHLRNLCWAHVD